MSANGESGRYPRERESETYATMLSSTSSQPLVDEILRAVATLDRSTPLELPPIYEAVDPDALETVCECLNSSSDGGRITFEYAGYAITVRGEASETRLVVDPVDPID